MLSADMFRKKDPPEKTFGPNDPLSTSTRATKRNLLVASVLAIAANAFNISIDKIPIGGLSINFDNRLFGFLLLIVVIYFLATFILYYAIDMKNLKATVHQEISREWYEKRIRSFASDYCADNISPDLQQLAPEGHQVNLVAPLSGRLAGNQLSDTTKLGEQYHLTPPKNDKGQTPQRLVQNQDNEAIFQRINDRLDYWVKRFPRARATHTLSVGFIFYATRTMYFLRNYIVDGVLPVVLGVIALTALTGFINLHFLQDWVPPVHPAFQSTPPFDNYE